ncbi:uncharacterized protein BO72DRAFT_5674 [Aspergillus fijiensis CBS 313.89]|uniref:Extracellular membrane protein CFEM domain-containing protein n=1 Tax=Aspergillus fijiensis CBS 313.89 TaxID=1448319 RepID=A0A8G1RZ80_9EURO|nr:uncharacterized protein BO72DRAFT_5674 [Aspergillus fijiensis CBS 313.89]RAK82657.1 hypothetical protein BO72DRAFT_5674 [Aspergillus fijiensis CBS 313.89]
MTRTTRISDRSKRLFFVWFWFGSCCPHLMNVMNAHCGRMDWTELVCGWDHTGTTPDGMSACTVYVLEGCIAVASGVFSGRWRCALSDCRTATECDVSRIAYALNCYS